MKAVRLHDKGDIRVEDVAMAPAPGPAEVRIRVAFAGICGSDIHNYRTGQWITRRPSIAGHEFSGVIENVGSAVDGLAPGNPVIADSRVWCGGCRNCGTGHVHLCEHLGFVGEATDGGFAEYVTLPARLVLPCAPDARLDIAALAEPLAVALHALSRIAAGPRDPVLIVGCGPIGALCAVAARLDGDRPLWVADTNRQRRDQVADLTGAIAIDLNPFDPFDTPVGRPVRHVIDTTGNAGVIAGLIGTLSGATLALVGIGDGTLTLDPVHLVEREVSLVGCHAFAGELGTAIAMLHDHPDMFAPLIAPMIGLDDVPGAYRRYIAGQAQGIKTMIRMDPSGSA